MLGSFSLEKKRLWGDFIAVFQHINGTYRKAGDGLFIRKYIDRTRNSGFKLKKKYPSGQYWQQFTEN